MAGSSRPTRARSASSAAAAGELIDQRPDEGWIFVDETGRQLAPSEKPGSATLVDGQARACVVMGVYRPDGELRWLEENTHGLRSAAGELDAVVITFADVTERFEADKRVRSERDFTARVLNTIADGVLVTDELPDGGRVIVHVNDRICEITGYPREQLLGARTPFPWWPEDRHEELAAAFARRPPPAPASTRRASSGAMEARSRPSSRSSRCASRSRSRRPG